MNTSVSRPMSLAVLRWKVFADQAGAMFNVRGILILCIIATESSGNPSAQARSTSARGLMQLTRAAAADVGADWEQLFDPWTNIKAGTEYLSRLIKKFGERGGVEAYYEGAGNEQKSLYGQHPVLEDAAREYADRVFSYEPAALDGGNGVSV